MEWASKAVFLQAAIERAAAQAQGLARVAHVAAITRERFLDQDFFNIFQTHVVEAQWHFAGLTQAKIAGPDRIAFRKQHGAFDRVIEFADISGPGMIEQKLQSDRLESREIFAIALSGLAKEM